MSQMIAVFAPGDVFYTRSFRGDEILVWTIAMDGTVTRKTAKKKKEDDEQ